MIRVLIVEDDPMVAEFNKRYLAEIDHFTLVGIAHNVADALGFIEKEKIDLLLLDVYMPGKNGLELLTSIREQKKAIDVILITAASDVEKIQTALRYGVVDYLIKPFEFERLNQALTSYRAKHDFLKKQDNLKQIDLDQQILRKQTKPANSRGHQLPKGLTKSTLQTIVKAIKEMDETPFSTENIAERTDISRVSVGKYLKFLKDINVLEETITYGIGRPVSLYVLKRVNRLDLEKYLV